LIAEGCDVDSSSSGAHKPPVNPITGRIDLPETWHVAILLPRHEIDTVSGQREANNFGKLRRATVDHRHRLRACLTERLLPAAAAGDFENFTDALARYNHDSGMLFADVQGGPYNGAVVSATIQLAQDNEGHGVGQSSWGPGVFAWFPNRQSAHRFADQIDPNVHQVTIAAALNRAASLNEMR